MKKWKCTVCGQVFEGDAPPVPCPVCGAGEAAFELLEEVSTQWRCTICGHIFKGDSPPVPCPICGAGEAAFEKISAADTLFRRDTDDAYLLVGAGLAALEAARAIRMRNSTASITMVGDENHLPYNRPALSKVIADNLSFANLVLEEEDYYKQQKIQVITGVSVTGIDLSANVATLSSGQTQPFTKLLLATGSYPFNPIKSTPDTLPVSILRSYDDAVALGHNAAGKRVVLVGGGILGLEAAVSLRERGAIVTVVEHASHILPLQADDVVAGMLAQRLSKMGIGILCNTSVVETTSHGVVMDDGAVMAADLVVASMGVRSQISLATAMQLDIDRGIIVDDYMHTSHPNVWAAGDCAAHAGRVVAMAGAASGMGAVAGASMAGDGQTAYQPFVPATIFEVPNLSLLSAGSVGPHSKESVLYENDQTGHYRRLFFETGHLNGALYVGDNPGAKVIQAVAAKATVANALPLINL